LPGSQHVDEGGVIRVAGAAGAIREGAGMYKLADRLTNLPLILAGPILRRVTDKSVTVWIVVRQSANVTLEIYSGDPGRRAVVGRATRQTVAIGHSLHMLAITAQANLAPGVVTI
jgi:hypothetical protein